MYADILTDGRNILRPNSNRALLTAACFLNGLNKQALLYKDNVTSAFTTEGPVLHF